MCKLETEDWIIELSLHVIRQEHEVPVAVVLDAVSRIGELVCLDVPLSAVEFRKMLDITLPRVTNDQRVLAQVATLLDMWLHQAS